MTPVQERKRPREQVNFRRLWGLIYAKIVTTRLTACFGHLGIRILYFSWVQLSQDRPNWFKCKHQNIAAF
ncbi:hypothetical protein P171DRAFT_434580 [Karstenula rhodostoma CBS 690.94]|uniref:Uncharacterized protein n=1 Tax=Karstenula rhodostoma CBS 690.94 TaxID=1392251 RepID=A0A9P4PBF5_9PLEO|nr:hypothetical protein P171DRAFT_434580 [Karstenula rhodostoma CBS 690.94]